MYERSYGSKYHSTQGNGYMSAADIAKLMRADIKAAVKSGELPDVKYSVTVENYSGGRSINIRIQDLPDAWVKGEDHYGYERDILTPEAKAVQDKVQAIHNAYNYDGSEIQVDYFDVNYYGHAEVESPWMAESRAREKARQAAKKASRAASPPPAPYEVTRQPKCTGYVKGYRGEDGNWVSGRPCSEPATFMQLGKGRFTPPHARCASHKRGACRPIVVKESA